MGLTITPISMTKFKLIIIIYVLRNCGSELTF